MNDTLSASEALMREDRGKVRVLTLNRPRARNALSGDLISALHAGLGAADDDDNVGAIVLTGADPAFCAGVDLKEASRDGMAYFARFENENCVTRVGQLRTPIIGAINGAAFTGGLEIALGCDFLIASERAVFGDTHARVGILPGGGMTARLPQVVGSAMARRLSMTGEVVTAADAQRIGLVTEVMRHEALLERAVELATQIAEVPLAVMSGLKKIYVDGWKQVTDAALAVELQVAGSVAFATEALGDKRREVTGRNQKQIAHNQHG
jgi:enoyl-CoA hydratase